MIKPGDATLLPFANGQFDVVCTMDFLEHVENPLDVVKECARVLKPGGLFVFHTFNRGFLALLLAVKGLEWVFRNSPKHIHLNRLFIRPMELAAFCEASGLRAQTWSGVRPVLWSRAFLKLLGSGRVDSKFQFLLTKSLRVGYMGTAVSAHS